MQIEGIFESIKKLHILVVGDIMLDQRIEGDVSRISPEAPVPILLKTSESFSLGGAGNVAKNLTALGCKVTLCGVAGTDSYGDKINKIALQEGCDTKIIQDREKTTVKTRFFCGNHYMFRVDSEQKTKISEKTVELLINSLQTNFDLIIISDYAKGVVTHELIKKLKESKKTILMDPKPGETIEDYQNIDFITPNLGELSKIAWHFGYTVTANKSDEYVLQTLLYLQGKVKAKIIVTRSENGISFLQNNKLITYPVSPGEVYDVTGAGDSTIATFGAVYATGAGISQAARLANAAGSSAVRHAGVVVTSKEKIIRELRNSNA